MKIAQSRLTGQGQVSVPAGVRKRLGLAPGSVLEWDADGDQIVVRRAGRYTSEELHRALFAAKPEGRSLDELKAGIRQHTRARRAQR